MKGLNGAFLRYRIMAWVTGVVLAVGTVWFIVGYGLLNYQWGNADSKPDLFNNLWLLHGWLYVIYLIVGVDLAFRVRYSVVRTIAILIAGTIPFASFFAEALVHRDLKSRDLLTSS